MLGVQMFEGGSAKAPPGNFWSDEHDMGSSRSVQVADHAEIRNRCAGSVQESVGANMRSCKVKVRAYFQ
jgi:hypothetical protein